MSRTVRSKPSSGCYMRSPRHIGAERELERTADVNITEQRKAIPPNAWDDLIVSYYRGQEWTRRRKGS